MDLLGRDVTFATLARGQGFVSARQDLLGGNIVNADTPNYHRRDLDEAGFSRLLAETLAEGGSSEETVQRLDRSVAREVVQEQFFYRADRGEVDVDQEMTELGKTQLFGSLLSQLMAKKIQMYKAVLRDGRV